MGQTDYFISHILTKQIRIVLVCTLHPFRLFQSVSLIGRQYIQAVFSDDCLAFEWDQTWHWDGDQWSVIAPGFAPAPVLGDSWADVDCTATNHCLAVGGPTTYEGNPLRAVRREPRAARFDGTTWTSTPVPSGSDHLRFVSCANAGACVAIGLGTDAFGWIGDRWLALPARPDFEARALSCEGHRCLAVGGDDLGDVASAVTYAWTD